jgi:hypothetical protein
MQEFERIKVLFVTGFGPIVRDRIVSRTLYGEILNISFKEEQGGYLHTEPPKGAPVKAGLLPLFKVALCCTAVEDPERSPPMNAVVFHAFWKSTL